MVEIPVWLKAPYYAKASMIRGTVRSPACIIRGTPGKWSETLYNTRGTPVRRNAGQSGGQPGGRVGPCIIRGGTAGTPWGGVAVSGAGRQISWDRSPASSSSQAVTAYQVNFDMFLKLPLRETSLWLLPCCDQPFLDCQMDCPRF